MKKLVLFLLLSALLLGCSSKEKSYVSVKGKHFYLDEKPYYFVGTNLWYGAYLGAPNSKENRLRLKKELDNLCDIGVNNLRVLASAERSGLENAVEPVFQPELGKYNEDLFLGLDFLLTEMNKRNMHAVLYLNNYWEWSGGMGQYVAWIEDTVSLDPNVAPWPEYNIFMNSFYRNKEANEYFRKYLTTIINRKNTVSGNYYYEEPSIMAWQLANEPRAGQGEDGEKHKEFFYKWVDETAGFIKDLDTNHLVTTGSEGTVGCLDNEQNYIDAHQSKNIDYVTFHLWAKNWGWFNAKDIEATYCRTISNAMKYINTHIELANQLNKPITLEEFGLPRDNEEFAKNTATTARDKYYQTIFDSLFEKAKNGDAIAGTNFWTWGGYGNNAIPDFNWNEGDDYTGDPPQEPQGLNSVFVSDTSTIEVIKNHVKQMESLNK